MKIQESGENYLETILMLTQQKGYVRSIDIANEMGFSRPSVSNAMKLFRKNGYIEMDKHGHITLTEKGLKIAKQIYNRHLVLTGDLKSLGVSEEAAKEDACRIEHVISEETFNRIQESFSGEKNESNKTGDSL